MITMRQSEFNLSFARALKTRRHIMAEHFQRMAATQCDLDRLFAPARLTTYLRARTMTAVQHSSAGLLAAVKRVVSIIRVAETGACVATVEARVARQQAPAVVMPLDVIIRGAADDSSVLLAAQLYVGADQPLGFHDRHHLGVHRGLFCFRFNYGTVAENDHSVFCARKHNIDAVKLSQKTNFSLRIASNGRNKNKLLFFALKIVNSRESHTMFQRCFEFPRQDNSSGMRTRGAKVIGVSEQLLIPFIHVENQMFRFQELTKREELPHVGGNYGHIYAIADGIQCNIND